MMVSSVFFMGSEPKVLFVFGRFHDMYRVLLPLGTFGSSIAPLFRFLELQNTEGWMPMSGGESSIPNRRCQRRAIQLHIY
jgi:hypothetical protein